MPEFIDGITETFKAWAESFGAKPNGMNCFLRSNVKEDAFTKGGAYFGFVQPDEGPSGAYHDFSLVVFPDNNDGKWLVSLCVGSLGFKNDYELASQPGIRRRFQKIVSESGFNKTSYLDIENSLPKVFLARETHFSVSIKDYKSFITACEIVDPRSSEGLKKIKGFLAIYADIRGWPANKDQRNEIHKSIVDAQTIQEKNADYVNVTTLLEQRKYLVLQGPPGTGKTRLAKLVAKDMKAKVFFTQFHAETSNADFVWGIRPKLKTEQLVYEPKEGVLVQSIEFAKKNSGSKVVLIIDEINRANLSNVLGPVFYLFEYQMEESDIKIAITDELELDKLPGNFYVIATMNTADRSLAVVDFALRRRFAWYTLWPTVIKPENGFTFYKNYFDEISAIFDPSSTVTEGFRHVMRIESEENQGFPKSSVASKSKNRGHVPAKEEC